MRGDMMALSTAAAAIMAHLHGDCGADESTNVEGRSLGRDERQCRRGTHSDGAEKPTAGFGTGLNDGVHRTPPLSLCQVQGHHRCLRSVYCDWHHNTALPHNTLILHGFAFPI